MENINEINFNDDDKKSDQEEVKIIDSFYKKEEEYAQFINSLYQNVQLIKGILYIFPTEKTKSKINFGLSLAHKILSLNRKKEIIDLELKKYGAEIIKLWNKANPANSMQVSSIRMVSDEDQSILISVKNSYNIKTDALISLKEEIGSDFDDMFDVSETLVLKKEEVPKQLLLSLLVKSFGDKALSFFFDKKIDLKMKDPKKYERFLSSDLVSENLKNRLKFACSKSSPAICYPK